MGKSAMAHLAASVRAQAEMDNDTRIQLLQRDRWIDYPRANQALAQLDRLLTTPQRERMPCMVLYGDSNIGKTQVVAKFRRNHPATFDDLTGVEHQPVVAMQMPATPDQHRFYTALLFELGAPHSATASLSVLERLARELLRRIAPRMLVVDEVHHLLAGSYREQRAALNLLKFLANDLKISIVLVGTDDAMLATGTDAQTRSRFTPFEIPRWKESDEFRRLLSAFEKVLPLRRASNLAGRSIVKLILAGSDGLTGAVSNILNRAAEMSIRDGSECISLEHLEHAISIAT